MAITKQNDVSIHEAGHAILAYFMGDLTEIHRITIDPEFSQKINKDSDGGVLFKYLKHPSSLEYLELDQFCLFNLAGFAADLVNEFDGNVDDRYFFSNEFPIKIGHYNYQGDMISFNYHFKKFHPILKCLPQQYNYSSIKLLTNIFSDKQILKILLGTSQLLEEKKTVDGETIYEHFNKSNISDWKKIHWWSLKEKRKELFLNTL